MTFMKKTDEKVKNRIGVIIYVLVCVLCMLFCFFASYSVFIIRSDRPDISDTYKIEPGESVYQVLDYSAGLLKNIYIRFDTRDMGNKDRLHVYLLKDNEPVCKWMMDLSEIDGDSYTKCTLPYLCKMNTGSQYTLQIEADGENENSAAVFTSKGGDGFCRDGNERIENMVLCCQLGSINLLYTILFQIGCLLIQGTVFILVGLKKWKYIYKIALVLFVGILMGIIISDLFERINTEVRLVSFQTKTPDIEEIPPGESRIYDVENYQCVFDELEIFLDGGNRSDIYVNVTNRETGKAIFDRFFDDSQITEDANASKNVLLMCSKEPVEKGLYRIVIENRGTDSIRIHTYGENGEKLNIVLIKHTPLGYVIAAVILILLLVYLIVCLYVLKRRTKDILMAFFLLTAILPGLCFMLIFTPWNTPDARAHYASTYRFSNMVLGWTDNQYWNGRKEDEELVRNIWWREKNATMRSYMDVFYNFSLISSDNTPTEMTFHTDHNEQMLFYSVINYFPQTTGMIIGRLMGLSAFACVYLARFLIFAFYVWACLNAIKTVKEGKGIFALLALLPLSLMFSGAISYDTMVFITTLNFTACIMALYQNRDSKKLFIQTLIWSFLLGGTKAGGYLLLLPLVILLWDPSNKKRSVRQCLSIPITGLLSALFFDVILYRWNGMFQFGGEKSGHLSTMFALRHPAEYFKMLVATYIEDADRLFFGMFGAEMGWIEAVIPKLIVAMLLILILVYVWFDEEKIRMNKKHAVVLLATIILQLIIIPAMLLSWTDCESRLINGLQGRYFFPLAPLGFILVSLIGTKTGIGKKEDSIRRIKIQKCSLYIFGFLICTCLYYMMRRYLTR